MDDNYLDKIDKSKNLLAIDLRDQLVNKNLFFNTIYLNYNWAISFSKILKKEINSYLKIKKLKI